MIRDLRADEVECRVSQISEKGIALLLYKDARCDMNILDETFGTFGWKRYHEIIGDRLYCTVEILDKETGNWISKQDVGTESYTEKEKGQASDSFKRACFNVGIGRELYTAPFIFVNKDKCNITKGSTGKHVCYDRFDVSSMVVKDKKIVQLTIVNQKTGAEVFNFGKKAEPKKANIKVEVADNGLEHFIPLITMQQKQYFMNFYQGKEDKLNALLAKNNLSKLDDMPQKLASKLMTEIERKRA